MRNWKTAPIDKAAELKTRTDESDYPDVTPIARAN